jgi:glutamate racemase
MFDSGVGGLTVLREMMGLLPNEKMIYFGDTARIPYGEKSAEIIVRYSLENAIFLMEKKIKILVIACNTASAYALEKVQQIFNIPVIGVIKPAVERLVKVTKNQRVAVLGTRGTIHSGVYQKEIKEKLPHVDLKAIACPLFVPLVEERFLSHQATKIVIEEYLRPLKGQGIDTILLGCTHYPLLKEMIQEEVGMNTTIIDSASSCAEKVRELLALHALSSPVPHENNCHYYVSDDPEKFRRLGSEFLGKAISSVSLSSSIFENSSSSRW